MPGDTKTPIPPDEVQEEAPPPPYEEIASNSSVAPSVSASDDVRSVTSAQTAQASRDQKSAPSHLPQSPQSASSRPFPLNRIMSNPDELPIVIPQHSTEAKDKSHTPFIKAYAQSLNRLKKPLSSEEFFKFLDGLNTAVASNSVLDGFGMTGSFLSHLPLPILGGIVGKGLQTMSKTGSSALATSNTKAYLQQANADIFFPRALQARVLRTPDMMQAIDMNPEYAEHQDPPIAEYTAPLDFTNVQTTVTENWMRRMQATSDGWRESRAAQKQNAKLNKSVSNQETGGTQSPAPQSQTEEDRSVPEDEERMWLVIMPIVVGGGVGR